MNHTKFLPLHLVKDYILVCLCLFRDHYIQGFEVPLLVLFTTNLEGDHNERVISRCMSKLIVVCSHSSVGRFFGEGQHSNNFSMKIGISGTNDSLI